MGVVGANPAAPVVTPEWQTTRVTVVDFDMSFFHLVGFMVKAAFAAIPAAIIIFVIVAFVFSALGGLGGIGR